MKYLEVYFDYGNVAMKQEFNIAAKLPLSP